jgi:hypothetical protein
LQQRTVVRKEMKWQQWQAGQMEMRWEQLQAVQMEMRWEHWQAGQMEKRLQQGLADQMEKRLRQRKAGRMATMSHWRWRVDRTWACQKLEHRRLAGQWLKVCQKQNQLSHQLRDQKADQKRACQSHLLKVLKVYQMLVGMPVCLKADRMKVGRRWTGQMQDGFEPLGLMMLPQRGSRLVATAAELATVSLACR